MNVPLLGTGELRVLGRRPSLPSSLRIYAFGDIHGRLDLLDKLLDKISADLRLRPVVRPVYVFLGDYIDRGPCSRQAVDRLIELGEANECIFLKGNHEQLAVKSLVDRNLLDQWLRLGGSETLSSYGVPFKMITNSKQIAALQSTFHSALPQKHLHFFRTLQNSFACGDFFFTHAGVRPDVELSQQKENDLLWIREEFYSSTYDFGKIIVHGHTPVDRVVVGYNRINVDTGAFATGRLTCLVIEGECFSIIDTSVDV